jgi:hypothetical protein
MEFIKKLLFIPLLLLLVGLFFAPQAHAALSSVSDTISTSRPSAAAPIVGNIGAGSVSQVNFIDNGSMFLASDSATLQSDTGQLQDIMVVASMSAQQVGPPVQKTLYFSKTITNAHHDRTAVVDAITATHMIELTPGTAIPTNGKIVITFPGAGSNTASPSATGFSFNNLQPGGVICLPTTACNGAVVSITGSNTITVQTSAPQSGAIYIGIGCTGTISVTNGYGTCSTYASALINPTVSSNGTCTGNPTVCAADIWKLQVQTQDAGGNALETSRIAIGTVNAVQVYAYVEPTLTFSIAGLNTTDNWGAKATSCGNETINTGIPTSATVVNFGSLNNGNFSKAAQVLTVSTNGPTGYDVTATSSGHLINTATGSWLPDANQNTVAGSGNGLTNNDVPLPYPILLGGTTASGSAFFGISACGNDAPAFWGGSTHISINSNFSNPWNTGSNGYVATLATSTASNINGTDTTHGVTVVRYAASIAPSTPAGLYTTALTYVATANF